MNAVQNCLNIFKNYILDFTFVGSFQASEVKSFKLQKFAKQFGIFEMLSRHGIYIICEHGSSPWDDFPVVFYIGQTRNSVIDRINKHLYSFLFPEDKKESTGRSFCKFAIDSTQIFDVYMIDSEILGIENHEQSIMCEKAFQDIFNVIVKDTKYIKLKS